MTGGRSGLQIRESVSHLWRVVDNRAESSPAAAVGSGGGAYRGLYVRVKYGRSSLGRVVVLIPDLQLYHCCTISTINEVLAVSGGHSGPIPRS